VCVYNNGYLKKKKNCTSVRGETARAGRKKKTPNRDSSCGNSKPLPAFLFFYIPQWLDVFALWSRKSAPLDDAATNCSSICEWTDFGVFVFFVTCFGNSTTDCALNIFRSRWLLFPYAVTILSTGTKKKTIDLYGIRVECSPT